MKKQPNFTKIFREYFGTTATKVRYSVRKDCNRIHDFVFLSSLVHDARFKRKDIVIRGKRLIIPVERDCWELWRGGNQESLELYTAQAQLVVSPTTKITWGFLNELSFNAEDVLWIHDIWLENQPIPSGDHRRLILSGLSWECIIEVYEPNLLVRLQDIQTPHPYSGIREKAGKQRK